MTMTTEEAVREHSRALIAREMEAVIDGYADHAVMMIAPKAVAGKAAIAELFANMPEGSAPPDVVIDHLVVHGNYALVTYHDSARTGVDSFVVEDGKIVMQSAVVSKR